MNMKRWIAGAACSALLSMPLGAWTQNEKPTEKPKMAVEGTPIAPGDSLNTMMGQFSSEFIGAADAMPADKYDFAPTTGEFKGVRTFGEQVRHVAQANYFFFKGWGIAGEIDPKTLDSLKTKDELMKALRDSFKYASDAINSITTQNAFTALKAPEKYKTTRASMAALAMAHAMDHYGQMVVYLRMNGIVPPASRPGNDM
jgi:uncharacterized damage-inducible protein DinB